MGIHVELLRVGPEAVAAEAEGRAWARPQMRDGETFRAALALDKSWGALQWLVRAAGCPVDPVMGSALLEIEAEADGFEHDVDLAPPGLVTAEEVARAAGFLARLSFDTLADFADEDAMDLDDVYPCGRDREGAQALRDVYADLQAFYAAAAAAGQAVLRELS